ncbi:cytochrome P450 6d3-like [Culicoides brevitarsis]|uniref:cytochrome P450 6d3-like n=1 Tax=Culicoides brevitarsis TaxID=469753 RepID=UPI00307B71E6
MLFYIFIALGCIYAFLKYLFSYWARNGFPYLEPEIPFGNMKKFAKKQASFGLNTWEMYQKVKKPFVGVYIFFSPTLLIRDVNLVHKILVTDVEYFYDRGIYMNEEREPMSVSLFSQRGSKWKCLRQKMSPLFSTGKLKNMFQTILNEVDHLDKYVEIKAENKEVIEFKDILQRYVLNIIGSVFFGIELDTIADPSHPFRNINKLITNRGLIEDMKTALVFMAPKIIDIFRINTFNPDVKKFFYDVVNSTISHRDTNNFRRNDFMQLMLDMRKSDDALTIDEIASNVFLFFIAGTETTSATAGFCLYELALQPDLMKRVQTEIDETLAKHEGVISYDSIQEMELLEMCIKETLRKYPGLPMLNRECTKDFKIPDSDLTIKKGTAILVSIMGLHYDPKNFAEPEKFDPERFRKGQETFNKDAYIPFGDGPRQCIAVRMGFMGAKAAVVKMLSKYNFETVSNKPIEFDTHSVGLLSKGGLPLRVSKR